MLQTCIKYVRYIDCNNTHKPITALQLVNDLLPTNIVTYRADITAKNAKYDNRMFEYQKLQHQQQHSYNNNSIKLTVTTLLQFVFNLLWTDIVTSRAAIAAKNAKYDNRMF